MSSINLSVALVPSVRAYTYVLEGASLERALDLACSRIAPEVRAAAQSILYGAVRHCFATDCLVSLLSSRRPSANVGALLEVALSLLIDTPEKAYSIVNETIKCAKADDTTRAGAGFINALLRRFCRERTELLDQTFQNDKARLNAPQWWIEKYRNTLGQEVADKVMALEQKHPPMILRINARRTTPADWCALAQTAGINASPLDRDAVILDKPQPIHSLPGFSDGLVSVQDAGAQLAAHFLQPSAGERILDACAAPGGKTAHLLELCDCNVTAIEVDPVRATRITSNLTRLGLTAKVITADAAIPQSWWDGVAFDAILLDAPCTASGIVRRHPDIVLSRRPEDIQALSIQQKRLLEALWPLLKVGGRLLYVVCSVFDEEGHAGINAFLARHKDARLSALAPGLGSSLRLIPSDTDAVVHAQLPRVHDGFFYSLITKVDA